MSEKPHDTPDTEQGCIDATETFHNLPIEPNKEWRLDRSAEWKEYASFEYPIEGNATIGGSVYLYEAYNEKGEPFYKVSIVFYRPEAKAKSYPFKHGQIPSKEDIDNCIKQAIQSVGNE